MRAIVVHWPENLTSQSDRELFSLFVQPYPAAMFPSEFGREPARRRGLSTYEIPDTLGIMQPGLENMTVIGQELAIRWTDGVESYFQLEFLRRNCPCAMCAGEKDILGNLYRGESKLTSNSFQLKRCTKVGGYGIQPEWMDGHGSGIFSFSYLRSLNSNLS